MRLITLSILAFDSLVEVKESYQAALEAFNRSLAIAPNNESIRNQRDRLQQFLDNL
ncbi:MULTISPECIES: hypothetical protein [Kamptonema]|uniref:hypothetical protein n=1 Tax=Kamptonema TaxID=1501433 RepID=UPI0001DAD2BA|nr:MULTISPECIES: hypothetical protein [Kamptonema]CBN59404.1 hypothetical protein OSCI_4130034 [Kamptonema sp. PCC 6506]